MASWIETVGFIASDPAKVGIMIALAQSGQPLDDATLAQTAGLLHQRLTGQPVETAFVLKHIRDLGERGLLRRDAAGFRWELTALGALVGRQWTVGALEPPGSDALEPSAVRAWRDRLMAQMEEDARLADEAAVSREELLAGQGARLAELRVLNRVLGEERLPGWLRELATEG